MGRKRSVYYIDPADLKQEFVNYKDTGVISEELGGMFIKLAKRFATRPNFSGYSYKEEFISDAIYRMVEQIDKVDPHHPKCNLFSYLTMICYRVFIAKITKENKYTKAKNKLTEKYFDDIEISEGVAFKKNHSNNDDGEI